MNTKHRTLRRFAKQRVISDLSLFYTPCSCSGDDKGADIHGGTGEDLPEQVVSVVKDKLGFNTDDMQYIRGLLELL